MRVARHVEVLEVELPDVPVARAEIREVTFKPKKNLSAFGKRDHDDQSKEPRARGIHETVKLRVGDTVIIN